MKEKIEKLFQDYPKMKAELERLNIEIRDFQGITPEEAIESMHFAQPEGERVQKSDVSDSTGRIALSYRAHTEHINREWLGHLIQKRALLTDELRVFESSIRTLNPLYAAIVEDMVLGQMRWDDLEQKYHVCRMSLSRYRKRAVAEMAALYTELDKDMADYLLD